MALNAYLTMKGQKQGLIKGSVTQKGRENTIMVIAAEHEIISPRDSASGLPTGRRMHKPFIITKEVDRSTPLLYDILVNNENIIEWQLDFFAATSAGHEANYYTVKLINANISDIKFIMPNSKDPQLIKLNDYETISFTYQKIEWEYKDGNIMAADDWESQNT